MNKIFTSVAAALLTAGPALAQITVVNTQGGNFGPVNGGSFSITYQVLNPNSVLVAGFYIDGGNGAVTGLSFGTGVGNQAANGLITQDRSSLSYFLNPSTSVGLTLSGTTAAATGVSAGYFIWELTGVDLTAPVQSASGANGGTQILTLSPNAFIVDMLGVNDFGISDVSPDAGAVQTEVSQLFIVPGGGQLATGQATAGSAGTHNLGWTVTGGSGNYGELAYAFTAVPEPTTFSLVGLSGLAFILARRRSNS